MTLSYKPAKATKHVAIVGDVTHSRVARSNLIALRTLGARVTVVAPATLMPSGAAAWAARDGFALSHELDAVLPTVDAAMMLRVQSERTVRQIVQACAGNLSEAARRLGISRNTLYRKMRELGLTLPR